MLAELLTSELLHPGRLWLAALIPLFAWYALTRTQESKISSVMRCIAMLLVIFALAEPVSQRSESEEELTAMLDLSESISIPARNAFAKALMGFVDESNNSLLRIHPFGREFMQRPFSIERGDSYKEVREKLAEATQDVDRGQTNIGQAIREAVNSTSASSLLLLSDGHETAGDALAAAEFANGKGVRVFPLVPDASRFQESGVTISGLYAPITVNTGERVELRTSIKNSFDEKVSQRIEVWLDKEKLLSRVVDVPAGEEKLIAVKTPPTKGGLQRVRVVLRGDSSDDGEVLNESHRWLSVKEKSKLLLLSGDKDDQRVLRKLLRAQGYAIEDIVADGNTVIPTKLDNYSAIVMNNIAKRQLPDSFLPQLENFVSAGGGLMLVGGSRSYGLGNYIDTPLEKISPLKFVPPKTTKRRLNNAVVLVIDKSRSMVFDNKIQAARRAALVAINALKDDDYVGVIGFDKGPFVIIKLDTVKSVKDIAERRLRNLTAHGQTNLLPALAAARQLLRRSDASRKHIIVLSDGKVAQAGSQYDDEIARLRQAGVSISAVALGVEADVPFMKTVARLGRGAFYQTLDPSRLPQIFVHDIKVTTGEKTMKENQLFPVGIGSGGLSSTTIRSYPKLKGFVETLPKRGSTLELISSKESKRYPILASWKYRSGRVVAFTSDANGRWSDLWVGWKNFNEFWRQLMESVRTQKSEKTGEIDFDLRFAVNRGALELDLAIFDEKLRQGNAPKIVADVIEPGGELKKISFEPRAPGRFTAKIEQGRPGDYKLNIQYGNTKLPPLGITASAESFGERVGQGLNIQLLSDIAYRTRAAINPDASQVRGYKREIEHKQALFFYPLIAAFFLVLLEAFIREIGFSWLTARRFPLQRQSSERNRFAREEKRKRYA